MKSRLIPIVAAALVLCAGLFAAPEGRMTLTSKQFHGTFYSVPESSLALCHTPSETDYVRSQYDSAQLLARQTGGMVARKMWVQPGDEIDVRRSECLAYASANPERKKPLSLDVAKDVFSTDLLYAVQWYGPNTADYLRLLAASPSVRCVFLTGKKHYPLTAQGIDTLKNLSGLVGIGLRGEGASDPAVLRSFGELINKNSKTLRYLCVGCMTPQLLPAMVKLKKLESVDIADVACHWTASQTAQWKRFLGAQEGLKQVYLTARWFTDDLLSPLSAAKGLAVLHLGAGTTGDFLDHLHLAALEELDLDRTPPTKPDVLSSCKALKRLHVEYCSSSEVLKPLLEIRTLEVLLLHDCDGIDDEFIKRMNLPNLKALDLSGASRLSAKGLDQIANLTGLRYLCMMQMKISDEFLIRLATKLDKLGVLDIAYSGKPGDAAIDAWLAHGSIHSFQFDSSAISTEKREAMSEHCWKNQEKWAFPAESSTAR